MREQLKSATYAAHQRLENALGLLQEPISRGRILRTLQRFYGFHAVWEPALEAAIAAPFLLPRRKLSLLEQDLRTLGVSEDWLFTAPTCWAAASLCGNEAAAAGSLYVMEGGTLGGQVIIRALEGSPWFPPGGLRYWNPYGADTGRRWTETVAYLDSLPDDFAEEAVATANACFDLLESWLMQGHREILV